MESFVPVILDAVVVALLVAAIVFGVRLHQRLVRLQSAQSELAALLGRLDGALVQASTTVSALKYNAARQFEPMAPRTSATTPEASAVPTRPAAPVATIKTAPTKVEAAKPAVTRRRRPASLATTAREEAADELMAVLKSLRNAG